MKPLAQFLAEQGERTVQALTSYIQQYFREQWQPVWQENHTALQHLFDDVSEGAAYGAYAQKLCRPIREQLTRAGFASSPGFPGTLATSREWGPAEERVRWMWCVIRPAPGEPIEPIEPTEPIGAVVLRLCHDHTRFRLPRPPDALALTETDAGAIVRAITHAAGYRLPEEA